MKLGYLLIACLTLSVVGVKAQDSESPEEPKDMFGLLPPNLIKMIAEYSDSGVVTLTEVSKRIYRILHKKPNVITIKGECSGHKDPSVYDEYKEKNIWYNDEAVNYEMNSAIDKKREPKYLERYSKDFFTALRKFVEKSSLDNPQAGKISPEELRGKRIKLAQTLLALTYGYNEAGWVALRQSRESFKEKEIEIAGWEFVRNSAGYIANRAVFDYDFFGKGSTTVRAASLVAVWKATHEAASNAAHNSVLDASRGDTGEHDSKSIEKALQVAFRAAEAKAYQIIAKDADSFIVKSAERIEYELQRSEGAHAIFKERESFNEFRLKNIQDLKEGSRHFVEPVFDMIEELLFSNSASK